MIMIKIVFCSNYLLLLCDQWRPLPTRKSDTNSSDSSRFEFTRPNYFSLLCFEVHAFLHLNVFVFVVVLLIRSHPGPKSRSQIISWITTQVRKRYCNLQRMHKLCKILQDFVKNGAFFHTKIIDMFSNVRCFCDFQKILIFNVGLGRPNADVAQRHGPDIFHRHVTTADLNVGGTKLRGLFF